MDRRQKKTRDAIFKAFRSLLEKKRYEHITVQDIIDRADVGRSTFYAHFETKDHLLKAMCSDIFEHIFEGQLCEYPPNGKESLESKLGHILWHLREHRSDLHGLFASESVDIWMRYMKEYLTVLFSEHLDEFPSHLPPPFVLNHLVCSFSETVLFWVRNGMKSSPEETAAYLMDLTYPSGHIQ
ncbi:MAG: TetR/AcrR family transcriptional regulator [Clostridia bacterium]|nr:TetR/AcrR family transcriptional regulator [Clostridia bacterium]